MKKQIAFLIGAGFICIGYFVWHANNEIKHPSLTTLSDHDRMKLSPPVEQPNEQKSPAIQSNQNKLNYLPESISQKSNPLKKEDVINAMDNRLKNNVQTSLTSHNKPTTEKLNTPPPRRDEDLAFNTPSVVVHTQSRKQEVEKADMPPPPPTHLPLSHGKIQ